MSKQTNAIINFYTIVSLISQFRVEKSSDKSSDLDSFQQWLVSNDHFDVLASLKTNPRAVKGIKQILSEDNTITNAKLQRMDAAFSAFATTVKGFDQLAMAVNPNAKLSEEARNVIKKFDKNETQVIKKEEIDGPSSIDIEDMAAPIASGKEIISDEDLLILDY